MYYYLYRFYDPNVQRWMNRDPLGVRGGYNLYEFVGNRPNSAFDPKGLTIYVCSRKTDWGKGNHTYFYDSSAPAGSGCKSCGMSSSSGSRGGSGSSSSSSSSRCKKDDCPNNGEGGPNTPGTSCSQVPNSDGSTGQSIMNCCKNTANSGMYRPKNNCHTAVERCLKQNGYNLPNMPYFGPPFVGPVTPVDPVAPFPTWPDWTPDPVFF